MDKEKKQSLVYQTKTNDVDEKGIVTVAVNGIGVEDTQHDISMPGSFDVTLKEDIARMRHFLNHDTTQLLGCPLEGAEKDGNLVMVSQLNLKKQIGRDTLEDYKLFAECGRTLEHSIGVRAVKRDRSDRRKVEQWKMYEFSTLTSWGSNPQTFLVNLKGGATEEQVRDAADFIRKAFIGRGYSEERLKSYDMELSLLLKSLGGGTVVSCPHCSHRFDYDSVPERTVGAQVLEAAAKCGEWMKEGVLALEIEKLAPEVREGVVSLLDTWKGDRSQFDEKGLAELSSYVRCPHCYSRVHRSDNIMREEKEEKEEPLSFWESLNQSLS